MESYASETASQSDAFTAKPYQAAAAISQWKAVSALQSANQLLPLPNPTHMLQETGQLLLHFQNAVNLSGVKTWEMNCEFYGRIVTFCDLSESLA